MLLQRWLSNSLGLLTAEELKDLYGLLKSRGLRWLTAGAHKAVTCLQSQSKMVAKLANVLFPSLTLVVDLLVSARLIFFFSVKTNNTVTA